MVGLLRICVVLSPMIVIAGCGDGGGTDLSTLDDLLESGDLVEDMQVPGTSQNGPPPDDTPPVRDDLPAVSATTIDICADNGGGFFTEDLELIDHTVGPDYLVTCDVRFSDGTLTIQRGVEVVFESALGLYIENDAEIRALGGYDGELRAEPSIRFRGDSVSGAPSWNGVFVGSASVDNLIENVEIIGAGFQPISGIFFPSGSSALLLDNALAIRGLSITGSGGHGIYMGGSAAFGQLQDVVIGDTAGHPLLMPSHVAGTQLADNVGNVSFTSDAEGNLASIGLYDNLLNTVRLGGRSSYVFANHALPYHSLSGFFGNGTLGVVIEPGVDFIMAGGTGITSGGGVGGRLTITGTAEEPVTFRGAEALAGFWSGITYVSNSELNRIDNVTISDAVNGVLVNGRASNNIITRVTNSRISNTSECGIRVSTPFSSLVFETAGNVYTQNGAGDMNDEGCLGNFME